MTLEPMPPSPMDAPPFHYWVAMPEPLTHLFEVTLQVQGWSRSSLELHFPVWTPGSYLVREYVRHLHGFSATAATGEPLPWHKVSKNVWRILTPQGESGVTVHYRVFANDLSVRTNHLDGTHGYFNGAALFFYIPGETHRPLHLTLLPPSPSWQVAIALPPVADGPPHTYFAQNFDTLVDSPCELGPHPVHTFPVLGKEHQLVIWGQGNLQVEPLIQDVQKIIATEAALFGGLPYDRYLFLLHLSSQNYGGLEHRNGCSLIYSRFGFGTAESYHRFLQLVAHEFFHLWNIKRIRPQALETIDYDQENYTPSLWFSEGTTSYYDLLLPLRAGVYGVHRFLESLGRDISRFLATPGRFVQPLQEASFDAWIKLYRTDAHSRNFQISYYLKGSLVSLLLDLLIRDRHANQRSLDDVMVAMWEQFGQTERGFTPTDLEAVIGAVVGSDPTDLLRPWLDTTAELPLEEFLQIFGLTLEPRWGQGGKLPYLGLTATPDRASNLMVQTVDTNSPAAQGGIDPGDELLALDGFRLTADALGDRLRHYQPGDAITLTFFHQDELRQGLVYLGEPRPESYRIVPVAQPTPLQAQRFEGWLGVPLATVGQDSPNPV